MKGGTVQITWHDSKPVLTLDFHRLTGFLATGGADHDIKDILDMQWSPDGAFLISGSVDNSCIIWDANKGVLQQILDAHLHYVQGVAWDPAGQYVASMSSDRTLRIYFNKPQSARAKSQEKINYVCQYVVAKTESQKQDDNKCSSAKYHLFHDETLPSFFRRLAWSPDGSFLVAPAVLYASMDGSLSNGQESIDTQKKQQQNAQQIVAPAKTSRRRITPVAVEKP